MKYKVGDKVRIVNKESPQYGKRGRVVVIEDDVNYPYYVESIHFREDELGPILSRKEIRKQLRELEKECTYDHCLPYWGEGMAKKLDELADKI